MNSRSKSFFSFMRNHDFLSALFLLMVCLAVYGNSLQNGFGIDDYGLFLDNQRFHQWQDLVLELVPDPKRVFGIEARSADPYYRPLAHIIPLAAFKLFGNEPFGYRIFNLFLFWLSAVAVYALVSALCPRGALSLLTALFYVIHPFNSLMVNYITAHVFAVQILAMATSIIFFLKGRERKKISWLIASHFFFLVALLCHETAMALPFYLMVALIFIKRLPLRRVVLSCASYIALLAVYIVGRGLFTGLQANVLAKFSHSGVSLLALAATQMRLFLWYGQKLLTGQGVVLLWNTPAVDERVLWWAGLAGVSGAFIIAGTFFWRERPVFATFLGWTFMGFALTIPASFIQPLYGFMAEPHWLFFPAISFFMLIGQSLSGVYESGKRGWATGIFVLMLLGWGMATVELNSLWRDEIRYCQYLLRENPYYKGAEFFLGSAYWRRGQKALAREYFCRALEGSSLDWQVYVNLGLMDMEERQLDDALVHFKKAIDIFPRSAIAHNNLGMVYLQKGELGEAAASFSRAIDFDRFQLLPRLNLAQTLRQQGIEQEAIELYRENLALAPGHTPTIFAMTETLFSFDAGQAVLFGQRILEESRIADVEGWVQLANLFAVNRQPVLAQAFYLEAVNKNPREPSAYMEFGKFLANQGNMEQAIHLWEEAIRLDPRLSFPVPVKKNE